jgi:mono/diheme cytochrome c family protein
VPGTPWLTVSGGHGEMNVPVMTRLAANPDLRDARLVFDKSGDRHVLAEVWIPGEGGFLVHATPQGHSHETVIAAQSGLSEKMSGKDVFERTCAKCHGLDGSGNQSADTFFKTTLPRLNSDSVQAKSEEELREIVTQGKRMMDPVRVGQSTVQHLLPTESVEAVLAYVRTFRKK